MTGSRPGALVAGAAVEAGASVLRWLAPLVLLGGIGILMFNAGSSETTGAYGLTETELNGVGVAGLGFIALAVAVFFGRGSLAHLGRVIRGESSFIDVFFVRQSVIASLIAIGAAVLGVILIVTGLLGG